jgi:hypothetical protein
VVELAQTGGPRRRERRATATLPERLRSALTARGWVRRPEPRVRFGQPVLPGIPLVGPGDRAAALDLVRRAEALRAGRLVHLGAVHQADGKLEWFPRGTSAAWQRSLHGLDELVAVGIAGVTAPTPEERRAWYDLATSSVRDWTRRVPSGHPVASAVPALARRVRNLLLVQALFGPELRKDVETRRDLLTHLFEQTGVLAGSLETHPADPWLIVAANALFLAGRFFDGMEARGWVDLGTTTLWAQLREQVREDGGHQSRSPVWQAFVLGEYLTTLAALRADNDDVPMWGRKRVKGMADCLARLAHPDGTLSQFDVAVVDDPWTVPELLAVAAVVLHEPAFAMAPSLPGVWPLLLVGESGRRVYESFSHATPPAQARALRRIGFYVLAGTPGDAMIVDGGVRSCNDGIAPFGYELAVGGLPLVVGAPVASEAPGEIAEHARSVRSRNVLVPLGAAGQEAASTESRFTVREGVQYFVGNMHGTSRLGADLRFRRRLFCVPDKFWLVTDELMGGGTFTGESLIHLHPDAVVRADCAGRPVVSAHRSAESSVMVLVGGVKSLGLSGGMPGPAPQGWYPTGDGSWRPSPVIAIRTAGALPLLTGYAFVPRSAGMSGELVLAGDAFELRATVRLADTVYEITAVQDEVSLVVRAGD